MMMAGHEKFDLIMFRPCKVLPIQYEDFSLGTWFDLRYPLLVYISK